MATTLQSKTRRWHRTGGQATRLPAQRSLLGQLPWPCGWAHPRFLFLVPLPSRVRRGEGEFGDTVEEQGTTAHLGQRLRLKLPREIREVFPYHLPSSLPLLCEHTGQPAQHNHRWPGHLSKSPGALVLTVFPRSPDSLLPHLPRVNAPRCRKSQGTPAFLFVQTGLSFGQDTRGLESHMEPLQTWKPRSLPNPGPSDSLRCRYCWEKTRTH